MNTDQRSFRCNVLRLAQAESKTYRARTALDEKSALLQSNRKHVVPIANSLDKPLDDYGTVPSTSLTSGLNLILLIPDTDWNADVSATASYQTAHDGVDTLDISLKDSARASLAHSPDDRPRSTRGAWMLTQGDADNLCWLCHDGHVMHRCPYLTW